MGTFKENNEKKLKELKSFLEENGDSLEIEDEVEEYEEGRRRYTAYRKIREAIGTISIDNSCRAYSYFHEKESSASSDYCYNVLSTQHKNKIFTIKIYHKHRMRDGKAMFKYSICLSVFDIEELRMELTFDNISINEMLIYFNELMNSFLVGFGDLTKQDGIDLTDPVFRNPLGN